jgi:hypothetical protein
MNNKLVDARYDAINYPKNNGDYSFLSFCMIHRNYIFIESNQLPSEYQYKNIFNGKDWEYIRVLR